MNQSAFEQQVEHFLRDPDVDLHSQYCRNIDAVGEGLGHQNVKAMICDDIQSQPEAFLASIEQFLGIPARDHSNHNNLNRRINTTETPAPPALFRKHCAPIVARELEGLLARGVAVPQQWMETPG